MTAIQVTSVLCKTERTMENQPFEDASPMKNGDVPLSC